MLFQGDERDTLTFTNHQFQIPIPSASFSISTSLSLNSVRVAAETEDESTSTFSPSYCELLGSIGGPPTPATNYYAGKRALEQQLADAGDSDECVDPRKRRLMKNRESATRSRARKQAFMNELKVEVARLEGENLKLKKQCQELKSALAAASAPTKKLRRTSSAQF
ncbi:BZIP transcription factor [Rhynchospora pubera]|uniref:BZIP transcription factor n=1 Tax=Rhynchospora pubera TaxID=906938 RepID=A0AAV8EE56_9POAL|nr:BZIP transcription factor [Rhynchospora pubera]